MDLCANLTTVRVELFADLHLTEGLQRVGELPARPYPQSFATAGAAPALCSALKNTPAEDDNGRTLVASLAGPHNRPVQLNFSCLCCNSVRETTGSYLSKDAQLKLSVGSGIEDVVSNPV